MTCPQCKSDKTTVIETRHNKAHSQTRRRHKCIDCTGRFTTYESMDGAARLKEMDKKIQALAAAFDLIR